MKPLKLREGFLAKELSLEVSLLPARSGDSTIRSTVMPAGHPQDYGRVVAHARMVEVVDKALGKD